MLDAQTFLQLQSLPYTEYSLSQLQKTDFFGFKPCLSDNEIILIIKTNLAKGRKTSSSVPVIFVQLYAIEFTPLEVSLIHRDGQTERPKFVVASRNHFTKRNH